MIKDAAKEETIMTSLSEAEQKVILLMRNLGPYERIEIKLNDNRKGELAIVSSSTVKEVFPT